MKEERMEGQGEEREITMRNTKKSYIRRPQSSGTEQNKTENISRSATKKKRRKWNRKSQ